jgi:hypothetical protein
LQYGGCLRGAHQITKPLFLPDLTDMSEAQDDAFAGELLK